MLGAVLSYSSNYSEMVMEKLINLKTSDGKEIHTILNSNEKNSVVAVFVHGLTGQPNEHLFYNAAKLFPQNGVDTFRFALYWWGKKNRRLSECSVTTHANDLNTVLLYLRPRYKTIVVVGHSLGSPTILKANKDLFDIVVLWDPSYLIKGIRHELSKIKIANKNYWLCKDNIEYVLSEKLVDEWEWFNGKNELPLVAALQKPLAILLAGKGVLKKGGTAYYKVVKVYKKLVVVNGASHCFDEEGTEIILLKETLSWIKKYKHRQ